MHLDYLPSDTRTALRNLKTGDCSRSLYFDRMARPDLVKEERNQFFTDGFKAHRAGEKLVAWAAWLAGLNRIPDAQILYAQLQSRFMVNMAGGVMENAGLCLDRFGMPYIPGTAVKGCARRMAIQKLLEERESGAAAERLASLLADIALAFGWGESDWEPKREKGRFLSDLIYALGAERQSEVVKLVGSQILGRVPESAKDFGHFASNVSFLPAYPRQLAKTDLELDVRTCHHPEYYGEPDREEKPEEWQRWQRAWGNAPDTEDPNPVVFPAIAPGRGTEDDRCLFAFAVLPLRARIPGQRTADAPLCQMAREWLREGLETFGLGAKTAAGYGWFAASKEFNRQLVEKEANKAKEVERQKQEAIRLKLEKEAEEERKKQGEEDAAILKSLSPEQQDDYKLARLTNDQFRAKLDNFTTNENAMEKQAIVRALRLEPTMANSRRTFWIELKERAAKKGGKAGQTEEAIRALSRQLNLGKMP